MAAAALLLALALPIALIPRGTTGFQAAWFDAYQRFAPRAVESMPATVVEIDARSLASRGRWPWPRSLLAELVERVNLHAPAAIGIDILMPEPDPLSPESLLGRSAGNPPAAPGGIATLPTNDALLARALAAAPAVLAIAGMPEPTGRPFHATPILVREVRPQRQPVTSAELAVAHFPGALASVEPLDRAASGWGLVSADAADGVVRRIPLVAGIDGTLVAALPVEMLRVATRTSSVRLLASGKSVEGLAIDRVSVATEADGAVRVYFSPRRAGRFVSAVDVLEGRVDPERLRARLVLIAVTALGLGEYHYTPVGERMPGSEIYAQLLENLFDGTLLVRPAWARAAEAAAFVLLGALLVWATLRWKPRSAAVLAACAVGLLAASGWAAFLWQRVLLDAATPGIGLLALFGGLLMLTLTEANRQRRALEAVVQRQREENARIAGELGAARQIQTAMLPRADLLADDPRIDLAAWMLPAREVGGDFYDYFRIDSRRLFVIVGDVAGKGLSGSIFMAVSKALYKSAVLRSSTLDVGALMATANREIARDNPETLFVTAFAGVLDLESGAVDYCNAGHENPTRSHPAAPAVHRIVDGDGPPLCALDDFDYRGGHLRLEPGELVCVVTDGVTEARDPAGSLYGRDRLDDVVRAAFGSGRPAREVVDAVRADVARFTGGTEQADDITILALRWLGPRVGAPASDVAA
jgi:serine phosphatase RsbU (regulator of sigma subunit)/CHASE2 domain-containing sensor protein